MPVPSESPRDLKFNAGRIDEFVTSMGWTYTDRFGVKHYTIEGINYLSQQAMAAYGYVILTGMTFTTGATIHNPNEVLLNTVDGEYYKWTGSFASGSKVIPENSTPASTGGIGPGLWIGVGDASLRAALAQPGGAAMIGYKDGTVADALKYVVTPEMHGAVGDGVTNDVAAFEAAEADAFANNGMLEAHGTYGFSRGFQTRVPFDFSKAKFVIRDDWDGATARYLINYRDPDIYTATMSLTIAADATTIPALSSLKNHCVYIESTTENAYNRSGTLVKKGDTQHLCSGDIQGLPMVYNFNSICNVYATPMRNVADVYMPEVAYGVLPSTPINHILRLERSCVNVHGGKYDVREQCIAQNKQAFNAFINVARYCMNVHCDGVKGRGWFTDSSTIVSPFSYGVNLGGLNVSATHCHDTSIWGMVDATGAKNVLIANNTGARMGAHEDCYNLTIRDNVSYTRGFMIGSGRGTLIFQGNKHYYSEPNGNVIEFRYDYSQCWDGDIIASDNDVYLAPGMAAFSCFIKFQVALTGSIYLANPIAKVCDSLKVENIRVHSSTQQTNNYEIWNVASNFSQNVFMPQQVIIDNIVGTGPLSTYVRISPCGAFLSTNANMNQVTTDVTVSNIQIHNYTDVVLISNRISDTDKPNTRNAMRWHFINVKGVHINASLPSSSVMTFDNDCTIYRIDGSSISGMTDLASYTLNGSVVFGSQCRTNGGRIRLVGVDFTDTLGVGTISILGIKLSSGTTLKAGSVISGQTSLTAAIMMSYKDASLYA